VFSFLRQASKTQLCAYALFIAVLDGITREWFAPGRFLYAGDIVLLVLLGTIIYRWYDLDARDQAYERPRALDVAVIVVGALALPYYFVQTRGHRRGLVAAIYLGVFCLGYLGLQFAGRLAVDQALAAGGLGHGPLHVSAGN